MSRVNVYEGEFPLVREEMGVRGRPVARPAGARELGGSVYELAPGASGFNLHAVLAISTANSPDVVLYAESDTVGVATRHPFAPLPEDGDEGIVGLFRREDNLRPS
jgi:hypothetical protein